MGSLAIGLYCDETLTETSRRDFRKYRYYCSKCAHDTLVSGVSYGPKMCFSQLLTLKMDDDDMFLTI